jgi:hypothetical protein
MNIYTAQSNKKQRGNKKPRRGVHLLLPERDEGARAGSLALAVRRYATAYRIATAARRQAH